MTEYTARQRISRSEVAHVADLARLSLTDQELDAFTNQLAAVLDHAADLEALDLTDVEPMIHPLPVHNVLRPDVVGETSDRNEVLSCAPSIENEQFRVPPVLGESP
ncbi:MAG: Asp-tRNA(Asn)/Glu-tRNA(Gln) amidotransferase subunit GatC [Acidimicrobiales bacterium]|nr:Asp-tRNA(Asn)/Glu-tRNA(Gln) amidotransferase subunit GatC [Acidimicrobiales bacterium]